MTQSFIKNNASSHKVVRQKCEKSINVETGTYLIPVFYSGSLPDIFNNDGHL